MRKKSSRIRKGGESKLTAKSLVVKLERLSHLLVESLLRAHPNLRMPLCLKSNPNSNIKGHNEEIMEESNKNNVRRSQRRKLNEKENSVEAESFSDLDSEYIPTTNSSKKRKISVKSLDSPYVPENGIITGTAGNSSKNSPKSGPRRGNRKKKKTPKLLNGASEADIGIGSIGDIASDQAIDKTSMESVIVNEKSQKPKRTSKMAKSKIGLGSMKHTKDPHDEFCRKCREGGRIYCCKSCQWAYHLLCLNPPLKKSPPAKWKCPRCTVEPIVGKVRQILSWRWAESRAERERYAGLLPQEKMYATKPTKEYFVQWYDRSYWECYWVSELQMEIFHGMMLRSFNKFIEDDSVDPEEAKLIPGNESDPLYWRFYRYGIRPEWLMVQRIFKHQSTYGGNQYLVKWRGVPYTHATWEEHDDEEISDFQRHQEIYHEWRKSFTGDAGLYEEEDASKDKDKENENDEKENTDKHINLPPEKPITDLEIEYTQQPSFIDTEKGLNLHDYQLEALNWLRKSWHQDINTILADEMGLGKTIQAIIFLYSLFKEGHCRGPFMVCGPLSTILNWERELELWAPDFYVVTYTGVSENRQIIRENEFSYKERAIRGGKVPTRLRGPVKFHVLLTSYEFISKDIDCLSSITWEAIVVDEAHRLKNSQSKLFTDLSMYDLNYKLLLTGTPIQNNLEELFNLLNFLCPQKASEFRSLRKQLDDYYISNEDAASKLQTVLFPRMLRRVKEEVLKNLPSKSEFIVKVELSPMQKKYYKYILTKNFEALNSRSGGHWATLMMVFVDLQKCCNHPYLFSTAMMDAPLNANGIYETKALVEASGKLSLLQKMLAALKESGNRVLIFSHSAKTLDILQDYLEGEGYKYERIDGGITGTLRQDAIDRFNKPGAEQFVFLLSTKAGGLGINLATADTVILYDSDWNPHNDIQAFSRAHRIGQKNKVMVYRFITRDSVEERIAEVARKKLMLNQVILEAGKGGMKFSMSKHQLDEIIRYGTKELFKEGKEGVRDNFTDEAIRQLLDRSKEGIERKDLTGHSVLSSIQVISHVTDTNEDKQNGEEQTENSEPDYWEKLLGQHCERKEKESPDALGKGKRERKEVDYKDMEEYDGLCFSDEEKEANGKSTQAAHSVPLRPDENKQSDNGSSVKEVETDCAAQPKPVHHSLPAPSKGNTQEDFCSLAQRNETDCAGQPQVNCNSVQNTENNICES